jgi:RNA polymerase sigma-70 factor, ECF subfamily
MTAVDGRDFQSGRYAMTQQTNHFNLEHELLSYLDAAYNLACWLVRNEQDAGDMVQEAYLRAFRFSGSFRGGNTRAWFLKIVRNTCYTLLTKSRQQELVTFDEEIHNEVAGSLTPEALLIRSADEKLLRRALEELPVNFREVLVLREFEQMSYQEIAGIVEISLGTVMSRLARARKQLQHSLSPAGSCGVTCPKEDLKAGMLQTRVTHA